MNPDCVLEIRDLEVEFRTLDGIVRGVDGVTLDIRSGETLGLVGESGCGKSVTAHSVMRLLPKRVSRISRGEIWFRRRDGEECDLAGVDPEGAFIREIRGNEIAMIFQEPMTSLSPLHTIGEQIMEAIMLHQQMGKKEAEERAIEMLEAVSIANARQFVRSFPHQYSGGMRQRAMIAMALSCNPSLLIADEPTTALDVTIQAQVLDLIRHLRDQKQMTVILITHDMGIVAEMADVVTVMYAGTAVEEAPTLDLFDAPLHPYTRGLIDSIPVMGKVKERLDVIPGTVPSLIDMPPGCRFAPRCRARVENGLERCLVDEPHMIEVNPNHKVRCWLYEGKTS